MINRLNVNELGERLRIVDQQLIELIARRMFLGRQVEEAKRGEEVIFRETAEKNRIISSRKLAQKYGINPEFAHSLIYFIMCETFKIEAIQLQDKEHHVTDPASEEVWRKTLRENLFRLTVRCAETYDKKYDESFFATRLHNKFELEEIDNLIKDIPQKGRALDLGCANGRIAIHMAKHFQWVTGYDVSPEMIRQAQIKSSDTLNLLFKVVDLEDGIPEADDSVSLVVMNMGVASEIYKIDNCLREIKRVLKHEGLAFLSFYNQDALVYRWKFIPWPLSLAAEINFQKNCLDIHWTEKEGETDHEEIYSVYAKSRRSEKIEDLLPPGLPLIKIGTHPSITSILPDVLLEDETVRNSMADIDHTLMQQNLGAYITAVVRKS